MNYGAINVTALLVRGCPNRGAVAGSFRRRFTEIVGDLREQIEVLAGRDDAGQESATPHIPSRATLIAKPR